MTAAKSLTMSPIGHIPHTCGTCALADWQSYTYKDRPDDEDDLAECTWSADKLPYSLRYGQRERMAVHPSEGVACPCFIPLESLTP